MVGFGPNSGLFQEVVMAGGCTAQDAPRFGTYIEGASNVTVPLPSHQPGDRLLIAAAFDGGSDVSLGNNWTSGPSVGTFGSSAEADPLVDRFFRYYHKLAEPNEPDPVVAGVPDTVDPSWPTPYTRAVAIVIRCSDTVGFASGAQAPGTSPVSSLVTYTPPWPNPSFPNPPLLNSYIFSAAFAPLPGSGVSVTTPAGITEGARSPDNQFVVGWEHATGSDPSQRTWQWTAPTYCTSLCFEVRRTI